MSCWSLSLFFMSEAARASHASLMRLQKAASDMPSWVNRYAEARPGAAAILAASWSGGGIRTSDPEALPVYVAPACCRKGKRQEIDLLTAHRCQAQASSPTAGHVCRSFLSSRTRPRGMS
jgi:hypothetical protein